MKNILLTALLFVLLNHCFCQTDERVKDGEVKLATKTLQSSSSSGFLSYNSFTKLNATNDGISAEGNINYAVNPSWSFNLNISTPVSSQTERVKPLTLAGLSNNSALTIGSQFISWGNGFSFNQTKYNNAISKVGGNPADFNYESLTPDQQRKFDRISAIDWGTAFFISGKFGIEQQSFSYAEDQVSFNEVDDSKIAYKLSANVGILNSWGILAIAFTHKSGYQADDPIKYYIPITSMGVQIERTLSPGAPVHQNSEKFRLEYLSSGYEGTRLRINPNINLETSQKVFSFEFPVYFLTSDKDRTNFNGGIYAGYVSDRDFKFNTNKNNFGFGVFIGANFTNLFQ